MAKYKLKAVTAFETVIPESPIVFHTIHGVEVSTVVMPERRWTTHAGTVTTARNKQDRDRLLQSGNWTLA